MDCLTIILMFVVVIIFIYYCLAIKSEQFNLDHYLYPNYESGVNTIRGDLPIYPIKKSWFNTRYGPSSLAPGFMNF